jgi:hypothetical protein
MDLRARRAFLENQINSLQNLLNGSDKNRNERFSSENDFNSLNRSASSGDLKSILISKTINFLP